MSLIPRVPLRKNHVPAIIIGGLFVFIVAGFFIFALAICNDNWCDIFSRISPASNANVNAGSNVNSTELSPFIVNTPPLNSIVTSPLLVAGRARGTWFFEGSFPVSLLDSRGKPLATVPTQAQGEWMTTDYVDFAATLNFDAPETDAGSLAFTPDDPRGTGAPQTYLYPVRFR